MLVAKFLPTHKKWWCTTDRTRFAPTTQKQTQKQQTNMGEGLEAGRTRTISTATRLNSSIAAPASPPVVCRLQQPAYAQPTGPDRRACVP